MKSLLIAIAAIFTTGTVSDAAPNLLTNGDFASGTLTPWVATGSAAIAGGVCSLPNASIKQTVTTVAGQRYYLSFDPNLGFGGGSIIVSALAGGGGATLGTRTLTFAYPPEALIFTATSTITDITIAGSLTGGFGGPSVDNVVLMVLPPCKFRGNYTGTLTTTLSLSSPVLAQSIATRLKGRIEEDGRILLVNNGDTIMGGRIFNDGTYFLKPDLYTVLRGTAGVQPNHLILGGTSAGMGSIDDLGNSLAGTDRRIFSLSKLP